MARRCHSINARNANCKLQPATNNGEKLGAKISCEGLVWCDCRIFLFHFFTYFVKERQRQQRQLLRDDGAKNKNRARRQYNQW